MHVKQHENSRRMKKGEGQANTVTIYVHLQIWYFSLYEPTEKQIINHLFLHELLNTSRGHISDLTWVIV